MNSTFKLNLLYGSISNASVDVIINSTGKNLNLDDGSLSKSILNAAGPQIQQECNKKYPKGITTSTIAVTGGYNLQCKNVFHVGLDTWNEASSDIILQQLTQIITDCLQTADEMGAKSIAFPILGTGVLKYPIDILPKTMYEAVKIYSLTNTSQIKVVKFVILPQDTEIVKEFKEYFREHLSNEENKSTAFTSLKIFFPDPQQKILTMNSTFKLNLLYGSISNASVDVIINSTAKNLDLDSGSLSKSILNAAGPQIQQECNKKYPKGITTSTIAVTEGYNLQCKNVFHVGLDTWNEASSDIILQQLTQIITDCLQTADEMGAKSIAFPILGTGVLKYPIDILPETMYEAVKIYSLINTSQIKVVNFVILPQDTEIVKEFKEYFEEIQTNEENKSTDKLPDTWSPMRKKELLKMIELKEGKEYDDICTTFKKYLPSYRIIKIERIQNKTLYNGYQVLKKKFEIENPNITNEVHSLWHGTTLKSVDGISKKGFNRSYCGKNATVYGEGVYFSNDIQYSASDRYSTPDSDGTKRMFKCSVLVGNVTNGYDGLKVLQDSYNSAVDNISKPSIYVIFHDFQAYPNYLITFSPRFISPRPISPRPISPPDECVLL